MVFDNGTLTIESGTTVRVISPMTWTLGPSSIVVNDGLIDLGAEAVLDEPAGRPVVGAGFERSAPAAGSVQPVSGVGGLGLHLAQALPLPALVVTRGHLPRIHDDYGPGIARWFAVEGLDQTTPPVTLTMTYDQTELNGLAEPLLELHSSGSESGPWAEASTVHDETGNTFTGAIPTGTHFTAFSVDPQATPMHASGTRELQVLPSLTDGPMAVLIPAGETVSGLWIFDGSGRIVLAEQLPQLTGTVMLDVQGLAPGSYLLRTDAGFAARFVRR